MATLCLPQFGAKCITNLMPALCGVSDGSELPATFDADQRVLFVVDGLGWEQLQDRRDLAPTLAAMVGGPITTVAPTTTAVALTSITTGLTPGEHGIVGYRMVVDGQVLNTLRWRTDEQGDVRNTIPPAVVQPFEPFLNYSIPYVTKGDFCQTGFTTAHLRSGRLAGYRTTAVLLHNVTSLLEKGEEAVYCYYDGIDKVAHEYGFGPEYEAELRYVDRLVYDMIQQVPAGTTVLVTADHGHVDCGSNIEEIHPAVMSNVRSLSGEARFRWLHAAPGRIDDVVAAAQEWHGHHAWVVSKDQMIAERWFGATVSADAASRMGDVALLPFEATGFADPKDSGPFSLTGRHGSLTSAEVFVPCIATTT